MQTSPLDLFIYKWKALAMKGDAISRYRNLHLVSKFTRSYCAVKLDGWWWYAVTIVFVRASLSSRNWNADYNFMPLRLLIQNTSSNCGHISSPQSFTPKYGFSMNNSLWGVFRAPYSLPGILHCLTQSILTLWSSTGVNSSPFTMVNLVRSSNSELELGLCLALDFFFVFSWLILDDRLFIL